MEYVVWETNQFNEEILIKPAANFICFEYARDFVEYQATLGNSFVILKDGKRCFTE
ncbi:MAG: hypothetical protein HFI34_09985 [Lachnospiraceae bacterium]|nr:hypothetical protein [Lachnospiraceae bacterium]